MDRFEVMHGQANLAHLVESCDARLNHVCTLLAHFDVDASPLIDPAQNPSDAACAVDHWITEQADSFEILPRSAAGVCPVEEFQNSDRSNDEIVFSLVADLALLEGEAIRRRDDRYYWAINREAKLRSIETAKRPCLMRPIQPDWTMPIALDLEMATLAIVHERRSNMGVLHKFGDQMIAILNGAYSA